MATISARAVLALAVLLLGGCAREPGPQEAIRAPIHAMVPFRMASAPVPTPAPRVVLVTLDGVMWQDAVDNMSETMPRTAAILARGGTVLGGGASCAGVLQAGTANLSLPGYREIFAGAPTRCRSNQCAGATRPTLLDDAAANGLDVASISSWEMLARAATNGAGGAVVSAGRHGWIGEAPPGGVGPLLAEAATAGSFPGVAEYRTDAHTMKIALAYLREARPQLFHVGLGDTDEYAHAGDRRGYLDALGRADEFIAALWEETGPSSGTHLLVTTDHGRGSGFRDHGPQLPASRRGWIIGFGGGLASQGNVCLAEDVFLTDIAPTVREILDLRSDESAAAGRPISLLLGASPVPYNGSRHQVAEL